LLGGLAAHDESQPVVAVVAGSDVPTDLALAAHANRPDGDLHGVRRFEARGGIRRAAVAVKLERHDCFLADVKGLHFIPQREQRPPDRVGHGVERNDQMRQGVGHSMYPRPRSWSDTCCSALSASSRFSSFSMLWMTSSSTLL